VQVFLSDYNLSMKLLSEHEVRNEERAREEEDKVRMNTLKESRSDMIKRVQEEEEKRGEGRGLSKKAREKQRKQAGKKKKATKTRKIL
jgi:hypothetical protein